jgi:hypothetical protein
MNQVKGSYKKNLSKEHFFLNADKDFNYTTWHHPIKWKGTVGGKQVIFTQIKDAGSNEDCYDWKDYPDELSEVKSYIVKAIDDAMRKMD